MTYEEHVREVAEEIAISNYKEYVTSFIETNTWESLDEYGKELSIDACMGSARIAVHREAEAVKAVLNVPGNVLFSAKGNIDFYLIDRGLIPTPEVASNPCPYCSGELDKQNVCPACKKDFTPY
jgi:hypothetical protein